MDTTHHPFDWHVIIKQTYADFTKQVVNTIPQLIGAIMLLLLGWLIASLTKLLVIRLIKGLASLVNRRMMLEANGSSLSRSFYAETIGGFVFWIVLLFFFAAASNLLGWNLFTNWLEELIHYLPSFFAGMLIILLGIILSRGVKQFLARAMTKAELIQTEILSRVVEVTIIFTAIVMGIEQVGINVSFLTILITTILAVMLLGLVLGFSFGSKDLFSNIIGALYAKKYCQVGEKVSIENVSGVVLEITSTAIVLDADNGKVAIPGKFFNCMMSYYG